MLKIDNIVKNLQEETESKQDLLSAYQAGQVVIFKDIFVRLRGDDYELSITPYFDKYTAFVRRDGALKIEEAYSIFVKHIMQELERKTKQHTHFLI